MASKRPRTLRREADRKTEALIAAKEKLADLEPGGTEERPIVVDSASLVEPRALRERCLACDSAVDLVDHRAVHVRGTLVREVVVKCKRCARQRSRWLRVAMQLH